MAERIVSPGVFTRERDLSFLPQGISEIGAAIIGPTVKGPAFTPTIVRNFPEFEEMFGSTSKDYYTPYAVEQYLRSAGTVTVVRVLNTSGYTADYVEIYIASSSLSTKSLAVLAPSRGGSDGTADLTGCKVVTGSDWSSSQIILSGSNWGAKSLSATTMSFSFNTSSADYIGDVFSEDAQVQKAGQSTVPVYLYKNFKYAQNSGNGYSSTTAITASAVSDGLDMAKTYSEATTPWIQSNGQGPTYAKGVRTNLFRVKTRSTGNNVNNKYKIVILNMKTAANVAGSDFGTFSLQVRQTGLDDNDLTKDNVIEQYDGLNFDPESPSFFARRIGDRYVAIDSNGKLTYHGDWPNMSKYIYVDPDGTGGAGSGAGYTEVKDKAIPPTLLPMGHSAIHNPFGSDSSNVPTWTFKATQSNAQDEFDSNVPYGHDYANADAEQYLCPDGNTAFGNGSHTSMSIEDFFGHSDASTLGTTYSDGTEKVTLALSHMKQRKFVVPFQGGFDSVNPAVPKYTGADIVNTNTQGFDCSTSSAGGTTAYKKAINAISNADEFDINMLVTPGIIHGLHSKITNHAISKCEARGDAFYVLDCGIKGGTIASAVSTTTALDTNYAATYYPWVKIVDRNTSLPIWVPPSVVLPGVIAYTDKVAHEWFAPAGLNRGGLTTVLEAQTRLTHAERDELYEDRINPIASFPGQGVVVWGQKTLQGRPSALDRVNVRRLLIRLKKFIASSSRYLVFEQNTTATRNRFLNIVNPFLESVQSNSGLSAFRVVMDDTNNTPDVVDRNQLVGQIFIQPTRTAEFIVLDFVVLPTGATFPS
jgi:hypothetical protein